MAEIKLISVISKLRPRIDRGQSVEFEEIAAEIAEQSGFDRGDALNFAHKFSSRMEHHLMRGRNVKMGDMGTFYVETDKNKKLRVAYRATRAFLKRLQNEFKGSFVNGENAGLEDAGWAQTWLKDNPEDVVVMRDGSRTSL